MTRTRLADYSYYKQQQPIQKQQQKNNRKLTELTLFETPNNKYNRNFIFISFLLMADTDIKVCHSISFTLPPMTKLYYYFQCQSVLPTDTKDIF